jgi:hypothetical protein
MMTRKEKTMAPKTEIMADTIHDNVRNLPTSLRVAGYVTGSKDIKWTDADWAKFKRHVRINQFPGVDDKLGNVLDIENRAWTIPRAVTATKMRQDAGRDTTLYISAGSIGALAAALKAAGCKVTSTFLWMANWNLNMDEATNLIGTHIGGYRLVAVQWASPSSNPATRLPGTNLTLHEANADLSVADEAWLPARPAPVPVPSGLRHAILVGHNESGLYSLKVTSKDHGKTWLTA